MERQCSVAHRSLWAKSYCHSPVSVDATAIRMRASDWRKLSAVPRRFSTSAANRGTDAVIKKICSKTTSALGEWMAKGPRPASAPAACSGERACGEEMFANRALRPLQLHHVPRRRASIGRRVTSCKKIGRRRLVAYAGACRQVAANANPVELSTDYHLVLKDMHGRLRPGGRSNCVGRGELVTCAVSGRCRRHP